MCLPKSGEFNSDLRVNQEVRISVHPLLFQPIEIVLGREHQKREKSRVGDVIANLICTFVCLPCDTSSVTAHPAFPVKSSNASETLKRQYFDSNESVLISPGWLLHGNKHPPTRTVDSSRAGVPSPEICSQDYHRPSAEEDTSAAT